MKHSELLNPIQSYKNLQRELDDEHQRLLRQREKMLSRQNDRLDVYQKLDLVEFFNYSPSRKDSKENMMYHLSQKFKEYMRKLTQNNVYKRQGYLINRNNGQETQQRVKRELFTSRSKIQGSRSKIQGNTSRQRDRERSQSCRSRKSNVQRNSDLGRMFQTMKYYQQKYQSQTQNNQLYQSKPKIPRQFVQNHNPAQGFYDQTNFNSPTSQRYRNQLNNKIDGQIVKNTINYQDRKQTKTFSQNVPKNSQNINGQINNQIGQLRSALVQQQKIYLLTELNYYIKLFKQSQIKRNFLEKHLENLHQFILQIKHKNSQTQKLQRSKTKSKSKYDRYSNESTQTKKSQRKYLQQENFMLKKQLQIYVNQLNAINKFTQQDYPLSQRNKNNSNSKCLQVKKIDRFKQFAQHIQLMQNQLNILTNKVKHQHQAQISKYSAYRNQQTQIVITDLKSKIQSLQNTIERQEVKKSQFFQEVKKFKQLMNLRNQEISTLKNQLQISQSRIEQLQKQKKDLLKQKNLENKSIFQNYTKFQDRNNEVKNQQNLKVDISQFINRTLKSPQQNVFDKRQFRNSQVTTNSPSAFQSRNSRVQSNYSNYDYKISDKNTKLNQNTNPLMSNENNVFHNQYLDDQYKRSNYHEERFQQKKQERKSRSKSKYSLRSDSKDSYRSKSKTDYLDTYEPKPYERYNKLSDYYSHKKYSENDHSETNPLYQRIN